MSALTSAAMVLLAATALGCLAGSSGRGSISAWFASGSMLLSMMLAALPAATSGTILLAAACIVLSVPFSIVGARRAVPAPAPHLHRTVSGLLEAALLIIQTGTRIGAPNSAVSTATAAGMNMEGEGGGGLAFIVLIIVVYEAVSGWTAFRVLTSSRSLAGVCEAGEVISMALAVAVMAMCL